MPVLLSLAARNILRNRARSALTFGAIFLGVAMTLLLAGFGKGLAELMRDDVIYNKVGALQVHRAGYSDVRDSEPLSLDMEASSDLERTIAATPHVRGVAPRLIFSGLINNGKDATMFVGRGVDPVREYAVMSWARGDVDGSPVSASHPNGGVMGLDLANAMGLKLGSSCVLQAAGKGGQQNALDMDLIGTLNNANAFESKRFAHVPLAYAQSLLRMPNRITEYVVGVDKIDNIDAVAEELRAKLGAAYDVETWAQLQPNVADVINFQAEVVGLVAVVFLVIVIFGVVNTMVMSVLERTGEIGTMMALGVRRQTISVLFVVEGAILALLGGAFGVVLALGVEALLGVTGGIPITPPGLTVARFHLFPHIFVETIGVVFCMAVLGTLCAAVYPAYKAARLRPVEALRAA